MKKILNEIQYDAKFIRGHTLQPQWYKILKVFILAGFLGGYTALFGWKRTALFGGIFFGLGILIHMAYRINTQKFTKSWLDFVVHEDEDGQRTYQRIGLYYYLAVSISLIAAVFLSQVLV